ncbi:MAG TPA: hypothetical protein VFW74_13610 [Acidimicrobiia bacterium]|nr:hypothetical protein [Acidimicrobiia bacterium]
MSKRAHPRDAWRPPTPRAEIAKAIVAAVVIVGATAGIVYLWPTGSSGNSPVTVQTSNPASTTSAPGAATSAPAVPGATTPTAPVTTAPPPGGPATTATTPTTRAGAAP